MKQIERNWDEFSSAEYEKWMGRNALRHNLEDSEYHPKQIMRRIKRLQRQLDDALGFAA